ncbi:MAG: hypothetical protein ACRC2O_01225 [Chitinophagaceae bacterium]
MKSLKTIFPICLLCLQFMCFAQKATVSTAFNAELEKILLDFPASFINLKGEEILKEETEIRYESRIVLPGSEDCMVNAILTGNKKTVGWEAVMVTTQTYEAAAKEYKKLYLQLIDCRFKLKSKTTVSLIGKWVSPQPTNNFSSTIFILSSSTSAYRKMNIELEMLNVMDEWKVNLRVKENS